MIVIATHILFHVEIQKTEGKLNCRIKKGRYVPCALFFLNNENVKGDSCIENMSFIILRKPIFLIKR